MLKQNFTKTFYNHQKSYFPFYFLRRNKYIQSLNNNNSFITNFRNNNNNISINDKNIIINTSIPPREKAADIEFDMVIYKNMPYTYVYRFPGNNPISYSYRSKNEIMKKSDNFVNETINSDKEINLVDIFNKLPYYIQKELRNIIPGITGKYNKIPEYSTEKLFSNLPKELHPHYSKMMSHLLILELDKIGDKIKFDGSYYISDISNQKPKIAQAFGYEVTVLIFKSFKVEIKNKLINLLDKVKISSKNLSIYNIIKNRGRNKDIAYYSLGISKEATNYEILGIKKDASQKEIKEAYYRLALIWHPDVCIKENAHDVFEIISEAYNTISIK